MEEDRGSARGRMRGGSKRESAGAEIPPQMGGTGYYNEGGQNYYGKGNEPQRKNEVPQNYYQQGGYQNYDYNYGQNPAPNPLEQRYLDRYPDQKKDPYSNSKI